ncbi:MFS transporter [Trebonia kvetii]|nr:MFS transporter [Trebonia kvetii]
MPDTDAVIDEVSPRFGPVRASRWTVLVAFAVLVACTQLLWLTFAAVTDQTSAALHVSNGVVGDLAVVNPLLFVVLAIPAGRWLDRNFGAALAAGAVLTAVGSLLRVADTSSFAWLLAGQLVVSAGQPLVLNASTKVAARYFPEGERTAAISVASAAQFVGILLAALTSGPLVSAGGLRLLLTVQAAVTVAAAVTMLAALRLPAAFPVEAPAHESLGWLRHDRLMWKLAALLFIGVGVFNAIATWLDSILTKFGHGSLSGPLIGLTTVAGIAGAAVLPGIVTKRDKRRGMLVAATVATAVVFAVLSLAHAPVIFGVLLAVEGFVLLACLPVALEWSEVHVGPARAGTATGALLLAGNLGGVLLVLLVQAVIGNPYAALLVMSVTALPGIAIALRLPDVTRAPATASEPAMNGPAA